MGGNRGKFKLALTALVVLLAALVTFGLVARHPHGIAAWMSAGSHLGPVQQTVQILERSYIKPLSRHKLFEGAVKGLRQALAQHKLPVTGLTSLPKGLKGEALVAAFKSRLKHAQTLAGKKLTHEDLVYSAIRGLLVVVGDRFTTVFTPGQYRRFEETMSGGDFGGIGVYIQADRNRGGRLTVVEPIKGGPAIKAGIKAGDVITAIDGHATKGMTIEEASHRIRGHKGTVVVLTIKRHGKAPFAVKVTRAIIHVPSVESKMLKHKIGYIRIQMFGATTGSEFARALDGLLAKGARALIIDLRNNGGGYVSAALEVVSRLLPKGDKVVSVVNPRLGRFEPTYSQGVDVTKLPLVVLVNRFSASASEITAGALEDDHRALLIGERTFGKGSIQELHTFADGGALKHTVAHYLTPNGKDINHRGIEPNIVVKTSSHDTRDKVLDVAIARLKRELATPAAR